PDATPHEQPVASLHWAGGDARFRRPGATGAAGDPAGHGGGGASLCPVTRREGPCASGGLGGTNSGTSTTKPPTPPESLAVPPSVVASPACASAPSVAALPETRSSGSMTSPQAQTAVMALSVKTTFFIGRSGQATHPEIV